MDEKLLVEYMGELGIRQSRIKRVLKSLQKFERFLFEQGKTLENGVSKDLDEFLFDYTQKYVSAFYSEDLRYYYDKKDNTVMKDAVEKLKYKYTPPYKLIDFESINKEYLERLKELGIETNNQLLYTCKTLIDRKVLSKRANIPLNAINKLTKMSDLVRIFAVKETRAQLYYEAGIDTTEIISQLTSIELRNIVVKYVEENNLPWTPTLPKEAEFTVDFARKLYKIVEI